MVEIIKKGLGIKTECNNCGSVLKFQWNDMKYLTNKDIEYHRSPIQAQKTQYIECPVCHARKFVRDDIRGWINGTERIYEEKNTEEQQ